MILLLRRLEVFKHQLGITGVIGIVGLVACAIFWLAMAIPLRLSIVEHKQTLQAFTAEHDHPSAVAVPVLTEPEQIEKFYAQFPLATDLPDIIRDIHQAAEDSGIALSVGEYKWLKDADNRVVRYEIVFPVQAKYQPLRRFIEAVGIAHPTLGLSEISIKRETIEQGVAQVKLSYVLLMRRVD